MSNFQLEKEKEDGSTINITVPEVHHLHRHLQLVQKVLVWHHSYRKHLLYQGKVELDDPQRSLPISMSLYRCTHGLMRSHSCQWYTALRSLGTLTLAPNPSGNFLPRAAACS